MRIKHWHKWRRYCSYNGGGTNGTVSVCEHCGSRKRFGVNGDRLERKYGRKGEEMRDVPWPS